MATAKTSQDIKLPDAKTLQFATKIAIESDKPILLDYYVHSCKGQCCIGRIENGENILFKSPEEYTSSIKNISKTDSEFIIETENSLYLLNNSVKIKKLSIN